jgi:hypothetical protein
MSLNILIVSPTLLKERMPIHDNVDEKLIYPEIKAVQDIYMLKILGTALYNRILSDIESGTLAGDYKTLVDDYLIDCLMNYVMSELPPGLNYQFWNKGVTTVTADNTQSPSMSDMFSVMSRYKSRAEFYEKRAVVYLKQNSPTMYLEYINPGSGIDTVIPERFAYKSPIDLSTDHHRHKRTYEEKYQGNIFRSDYDYDC